MGSTWGDGMAGRVRFVCLLHSHQPVGNFDHVIEDAYQRCYLPYAKAFADCPKVPLTNHFSGCLLEWLESHHPEYFDLLRSHVTPPSAGGGDKSWEMVGGAMQEPVLPMLPARDCHGQIQRMAGFVEEHFGTRPRGFWLAERVWEPALVKRLADAGVQYLTLDDSHFKAAGLEEDELVGGFITEDEGRTLTVYPASEKLRYLVPFSDVGKVIDYLRSLVPEEGERVVCYADDGEKFGVWPNTYQTVFEEGWLRHFLEALAGAEDEGWLICSTLSEAFDAVASSGKVYLPENSYREMTEWALPAPRLAALQRTLEELKDDSRVNNLLPMVRGGNWRSFRVKYGECGQMYAKMMEVSEKVAALPEKDPAFGAAQTHLYRGQCNCPYWHGVFGGLYLPHLRSAVYRELIRSELAAGSDAGVVLRDFDFDGHQECKLSNQHLALYLHPTRGGHLYEFDLRGVEFNVGDTFSRRYEAYHDQVAEAVVSGGQDGGSEHADSIHSMVKAKESGLAALLQYDAYLRESLVDHLSERALNTADFLGGHPPSDEGFRQEEYDAKVYERMDPSMHAVALERTGWFLGQSLRIRKEVVMGAENGFLVRYEVKNEGSASLTGHFAVEMNYGLLAGDAHDRYFYHEDAENAGKLATVADFGVRSMVGLKDHWLNVNLALRTSTAAQIMVCPVRTVSQSEGGFESVYQNSSVVLQWPLTLEAGASFSTELVQEVSRVH